MRLGTRWRVGATPPTTVPLTMQAAIAAVESARQSGDIAGWSWTLTFLEGRPIAEFDDGTRVRLAADETPVVDHVDDEPPEFEVVDVV